VKIPPHAAQPVFLGSVFGFGLTQRSRLEGSRGSRASGGIGDWVRYGNQKWGEKYVLAARITGYDVATLRNMAWIAAQFDPSLRNDELTWSHHALLAPLERSQQQYWLDEAVQRKLSVADLRIELRADRSRGKEGRKARSRLSDPSDPIVCPKCGHHVMVGR
jgi:hypothetical protein